MLVKGFQDNPRGVCNIIHSQQALQIHPICLTGFDSDYILGQNKCREKNKYKRNINI